MDATESYRRRQRLSSAEAALILLAAIAAYVGWWIPALVLIALAVGATVAWIRVPRVEGPDPALPDELVADLRRRRDDVGEILAIRALRKRYPRLGFAQAVRILRAL